MDVKIFFKPNLFKIFVVSLLFSWALFAEYFLVIGFGLDTGDLPEFILFVVLFLIGGYLYTCVFNYALFSSTGKSAKNYGKSTVLPMSSALQQSHFRKQRIIILIISLVSLSILTAINPIFLNLILYFWFPGPGIFYWLLIIGFYFVFFHTLLKFSKKVTLILSRWLISFSLYVGYSYFWAAFYYHGLEGAIFIPPEFFVWPFIGVVSLLEVLIVIGIRIKKRKADKGSPEGKIDLATVPQNKATPKRFILFLFKERTWLYLILLSVLFYLICIIPFALDNFKYDVKLHTNIIYCHSCFATPNCYYKPNECETYRRYNPDMKPSRRISFLKALLWLAIGKSSVYQSSEVIDGFEQTTDLLGIEADVAICEQIENQRSAGWCYRHVAILKQDPSICNKVKMQDNRDDCYQGIAILKQELAICKRIKSQGTIEGCYHEIACLKQDISICSQIEHPVTKDECRTYISVSKNDISICDKNSYDKNDCYLKLAIMNQNTSICDKIYGQHEIDECYKYANSKQTYLYPPNCESIQDQNSRDDCYQKVIQQGGHYSANYSFACTRIENEQKRDSCYSTVAKSAKFYLHHCSPIQNQEEKNKCILEVLNNKYK